MIAVVKLTIPVGTTKKDTITTTRDVLIKLYRVFSSMFFLFLKEVKNGLRKDKTKASEPITPVVVTKVKKKLLDSEKRILQMFSSRFKYTGRRRVKAEKKVSGPVPNRAVCQVFMVSTAIDQPARIGRRKKTG